MHIWVVVRLGVVRLGKNGVNNPLPNLLNLFADIIILYATDAQDISVFIKDPILCHVNIRDCPGVLAIFALREMLTSPVEVSRS